MRLFPFALMVVMPILQCALAVELCYDGHTRNRGVKPRSSMILKHDHLLGHNKASPHAKVYHEEALRLESALLLRGGAKSVYDKFSKSCIMAVRSILWSWAVGVMHPQQVAMIRTVSRVEISSASSRMMSLDSMVFGATIVNSWLSFNWVTETIQHLPHLSGSPILAAIFHRFVAEVMCDLLKQGRALPANPGDSIAALCVFCAIDCGLTKALNGYPPTSDKVGSCWLSRLVQRDLEMLTGGAGIEWKWKPIHFCLSVISIYAFYIVSP